MILLLILATENGEWGNMEAPNRDPPLFKEIGYLLGYVSNNMIVGFVLNQHLKWWQAMGWNGRCRKTIPCLRTNKLLLFHLGPYTTTACLHSTTSSTCFKVVNRLVNILKFYIVPSWRLAVNILWVLDELLKKPWNPGNPKRSLRCVSWSCGASNRIMSGIISTRGWSYSTELRLLALSFRTGKLYTTSLLVSMIFNHVQSIW